MEKLAKTAVVTFLSVLFVTRLLHQLPVRVVKLVSTLTQPIKEHVQLVVLLALLVPMLRYVLHAILLMHLARMEHVLTVLIIAGLAE